jgi:AsmA protein
MKKLAIIIGSIVVLIVIVVLLAPLFINVDSFRPQIEEKLSAAMGRTVRVGKISASVFSGGARADNISISEDPAFGSTPFIQASSLQIGLEWAPLIFSRQLKLDSLTIEKPQIMLLRSSSGRWNFSSLGSAKVRRASGSSGPAPEVSIARLRIKDGVVQLGRMETGRGQHAATHVYNNVDLEASDVSATSRVPFTLTLSTPGGGSFALKGTAGPVDQNDAATTPLDAAVDVKHLDLAATGFFDPGSGLGGVVDFNGSAKSDGRQMHSQGNAKVSDLKMVKGGTPARAPVALDYAADYALDPQTGSLKATVHTGGSQASANGTFNARGQSALANLKIEGKKMAVNDLEGLLPAFGVALPSGAKLEGGVVNLDLTAAGPLDNLVISGPISLNNTRIAGFSMLSKLAAIASLSGNSSPASTADTLIQTFSSGLRLSPEGLRADNIVLLVPSIGEITGSGTMSSSQALDFKMLLKSASTTAGGGGGGLLGQVSSILGGGKTAANGFPFLIQGTARDPRFLPNLAGFAGQLTQQQKGQNQNQGIGGVLGGFLGGKKKK